jgi:hypothetical protein
LAGEIIRMMGHEAKHTQADPRGDIMRGHRLIVSLWLLLAFPWSVAAPLAQETEVIPEEELPRVVPTGFYYEGQVAPTQMRNAAAIRVGDKKHVIVALVDNSGYAADIRAKIEGFWATDIPVRIGGKNLPVGVYPFGVTREGMLNIYDLAGTLQFSVKTSRDTILRNPRPLAIVAADDGIRFYRGRDYVLVGVR